MKTLSEEQFKKEYGQKAAIQMDQLDEQRFPDRKSGGGNIMGSITRGARATTNTLGLSGATDVFGRLIARSVVGNKIVGGNLEASREFIEEPTGKEVAGAVAQTATIPAGAVLTGGGSLAGQVAAGAGLGYIYDVGSDLASGEEGADVLRPGAETLAGAAVPVALRGVGAGLKGVGTAASNATQSVREGIGQTAQSVGDSIPTTGVTQRIREFGQRFPRAARRVGEYVDEGAEIAQRRETGSPAVAQALDEGVSLETVDFVQDFNQPTRNAAREMIELAEGGRGSALPQTVPGKVASEQLDIVEQQRKNIGQQIGEFSDSLSAEKADITPSLQNLNEVLQRNDINVQNGELVFENVRITPNQRKVLQDMYNLATERTEMSPRQIHQMDQLFSTLQREARFDGVQDILVEVPTPEGTTQTNVYKVFRDVFGQRLDDIAEEAGRGDIRQLNRDYRTLRNLQDNVEETIVRQSKREGINVDASESASVALRRLFSNAQSRAEYQEVYDQLDAASRSLGFEGPRADDLMDFYLTDMKPLYPETVPKTSLEGSTGGGGLRGAVSGLVERISEIGAPDTKEKRQALRALLEELATSE